MKKQSDFAKIIKQILNTSIKIRFRKLFDIFSKLLRQMFRSIIDEDIEIVLKKIDIQFKIIKKKKMHVDLMKLSSTRSMHFKEIVIRVVFLRFMYAIVCSTMNVMIEKIKTKMMFNNDAEVNCIFKKLANAAQLCIYQNINIIMINAIDERARFFDICEAVLINIESIIISISVFAVNCFNDKFFLKRFFQRAARMSFINVNNEFFKIMLHFLNDENK